MKNCMDVVSVVCGSWVGVVWVLVCVCVGCVMYVMCVVCCVLCVCVCVCCVCCVCCRCVLLMYCGCSVVCGSGSGSSSCSGSVCLVATYSGGGYQVAVDEVDRGVSWVTGSGPGRKRIRLIRKTPAHLVGYLTHSRPKVWKRLRHVGFHRIFDSDHKRRRCEQNRDDVPSQDRTGVG